MNLNELKAKAQAATPGLGFAAGPQGQTLFTWLSRMVEEVGGEEVQSIVVAMTLPDADAEFFRIANPQTVLALVKVAEAVKKVLEADNQEFYPDSPFDRAVEYAYAALEELEAME